MRRSGDVSLDKGAQTKSFVQLAGEQKLGIEAARLGLRVNCVVSRDLEYALTAYEAIDKEVPIRDRRWVVIRANTAPTASTTLAAASSGNISA